MNKLIKWFRYIPDKIDSGMRYVCARMSPDIRLLTIVVLLVGFSALSIYLTVSSIYNIGKHKGEQLHIEHLKQLELYQQNGHDSININEQVDYGEPEQSGAISEERGVA